MKTANFLIILALTMATLAGCASHGDVYPSQNGTQDSPWYVGKVGSNS